MAGSFESSSFELPALLNDGTSGPRPGNVSGSWSRNNCWSVRLKNWSRDSGYFAAFSSDLAGIDF